MAIAPGPARAGRRTAHNVRNFCIIAHIDHGKTTLSDRLLEVTRTVAQRQMEAQLLDAMDLERERGITIKMHPVTLDYFAGDGKRYELNFIDTPGHVDFSSEVSRSLRACEGALLVIDAAQGVEAQTLANYHLALEQNLTIIPVINKIDLPAADPERVKREIEELLVIEGSDAILCSAKEGIGIDAILAAIVERIPPPTGNDDYVRGLVFDAQFDPYRGVVSYVRVTDGTLRAGSRFMSMNQKKVYEATEVGVFKPEMRKTQQLDMGGVGYIIANIKGLTEIDVGDTLTEAANPAPEALPGYKPIVPMVYCGLYPTKASKSRSCARRLRNSRSTIRRCTSSPRVRSRLASDFAAAFSGCSTWKSCRSGSNATTISTSSRRRRRSSSGSPLLTEP